MKSYEEIMFIKDICAWRAADAFTIPDEIKKKYEL